MTAINQMLTARDLPPLTTDRSAALELFSRYVYGRTPEFSGEVSGRVTKLEPCEGNSGTREHVELSFDVSGGRFTFPIVLCTPNPSAAGAPALFIFLNFRPDIPDRYFPEEQLMKNNIAVARIYYKDVTDDSDAPDGLAAFVDRSRQDAVGKIGLWAFAASRALDYCLSLGREYSHTAVVGHSRLGKTALWAGAQDERFDLVCSNCSGCSGAAITRDKLGEQISDIVRVFPYWFCPAYADFRQDARSLPLEQHMLLALSAPRLLSVVSATYDTWADPVSEYLACCAAGSAWENAGLPGFVHPDRTPLPGESFNLGRVGYFLRKGPHSFKPEDWSAHAELLKKLKR